MLKIIHRWLGLFVGLILVVVSLSGSWLIYHREWQQNEFQLNAKSDSLSLEKLYNNAVATFTDDDGMVIRFPQNPKHPYQFWSMGKGQERIFIDQYTGEVLAKRTPDYWPYGWIFELHTSFMYGSVGETTLGVFGIFALILSIIGIILWFPKSSKNLSSNFKLRIRKNRYILHYDLHRQIGIIVSPFLIIILLTGISLVFSKEFSHFVNWITQSKVSESPNIIVNPYKLRPNLDSIITKANQIMPGGRVGILIIPSHYKPIVVRKQMADDPHPNGLNFIHFNALTGKVLKVVPLAKADFAKKLFNWIYPLHTGQILKSWYYALLFFIGFIPSVLLYSALKTLIIRKLGRP